MERINDGATSIVIADNSIDDCNVIELRDVQSRKGRDVDDDCTDRKCERRREKRGLIEALLFISSDPLTVPFFVRNIGLDSKSIKEILKSLVEEYEERDGGIKLAEISGGFQFVTDRKYADEIREVMGLKKKMSLSKGMLETLAIIAYKQPIVLADIDELRGVSSRIMIAKLIEKRLIKPAGRKNLPGRPLIYSTTDDFLRLLGLNDLTDLPKLSEIKELSLEFEDEG